MTIIIVMIRVTVSIMSFDSAHMRVFKGEVPGPRLGGGVG